MRKQKDNYQRLAPEDAVSSSVFINQIMERLNIDLSNPKYVIALRWKEIAGENLANHTCFDSLDRGVLKVKCKNGSIATLLRMNGSEILKKINSLFPDLNVKKVSTEITG